MNPDEPEAAERDMGEIKLGRLENLTYCPLALPTPPPHQHKPIQRFAPSLLPISLNLANETQIYPAEWVLIQ